MKLMNFFSKTDNDKNKKDVEAHLFATSDSRASAEVLQVNESSHNVDENGNVQLNFDDSEVQRVLRKRLESLRDYDLTEDHANA
ncbi:hypothetical protein [Marinobacter salsuginis]|uniref:hypothetical protein n=1 Tax=Marinobacter salsuginis TaxID=418719 RepID=UPI00273D7695|nr:hypothetical protein [Marinobacter salsuginis]